MTKPSGCGPIPTSRQEAERQARIAREVAALRDNLHRRKQQARARADAAATPRHLDPVDDGEGSPGGDCPSG